MTQTHQSVREMIRSMRGYLQSPASADVDFVRDEAVAYNDLCHEVNVRLSEVAVLIDQGFREDALQVSTIGGDLLELFELVDFPQRSQWVQFIDSLMIQTPPDLDYESATKLNALHAIVADLQPLLLRYRLLNLARAPLPQRIVALNALAAKDVTNPIWQRDAAILQAARLEKLQREAEQAIATGNEKSLQSIVDELQRSKWWVAIPAKLRQTVESGRKQFQHQSLRNELREQTDRLREAYAAYDVNVGIDHARQVRELANQSAIDADDEFWSDVTPALTWVDERQAAITEEQRAARLIETLDSALQRDADRDTISQALAAAEGLGERLPTALLRRGRERLESYEMIARRKTLLTIAACVLVVAASGTAIAFYIRDQRETARVAELKDTFTRLIDEERFTEADRYLESLDEVTRGDAVFREGKQTITQKLADERQRSQAFADILKELKADDSGKPNYALISRLRTLAATDAENNDVALQEAIAEDLRLAKKKVTTADHSAAMQDLQTKINAFFKSDFEVPARGERLRELKVEVTTFIQQITASNPEMAQAATQLGKLLDAENDRIEQSKNRFAAIAELTSAVGNVDVYVAAAQSYAKKFPDDAMAEPLRRLSIRESVEAANAWIDVLDADVYRNPSAADLATSKSWLQKLERAESTSPDHPFSMFAAPMKPHFEAIVSRPDVIVSLRGLFGSSLLQPMYLYTAADTGQRFYSPMTPDREDKPHIVTYYGDPQLLTRVKNFGLAYEESVRPKVIMSGHSAYAASMRQKVAEIDERNFTPIAYHLLTELRKIDVRTTDPILIALLMRRMLEMTLPGSEPLRTGFGSLLEKFDEDALDWSANWLSPGDDDPRVVETRQRAAKLLNSVNDWPRRTESMSGSYKRFHATNPNPPRWVGWVSEIDGSWSAMTTDSEADSSRGSTPTSAPGKLGVILHDAAANGEIVWINNDDSLTVNHPRAKSIGLPVYRINPNP